MKTEKYGKQLNLLLEMLPYALKDERMALKGGTSINLFHRNFPRLSVDLDLCYLPLEDRKTSFHNIHQILSHIKSEVEHDLGFQVTPNNPLDGQKETKIFVKKGKIRIKIEPNYTVRGTLFSSQVLALSQKAQKAFGKYLEVKCVDLADAYGGKICAALDRQHPRDLFDVKYLLDNEGITEEIKDSFLFYLISHNRPINELLEPNFKNISELYHNEFADMTNESVALDELIKVREQLINEVRSSLTEKDKTFLLSFISNNPDWSLVRDEKIKDYPSVKWKRLNQTKMEKTKREKYIEAVKNAF